MDDNKVWLTFISVVLDFGFGFSENCEGHCWVRVSNSGKQGVSLSSSKNISKSTENVG